MSWMAMAGSLALSVYGAAQEAKAKRKAAARAEDIANQKRAADLAASGKYEKSNLPGIQDYMNTAKAATLTDNPFLAALHDQSLADIARKENASLDNADFLKATSPSAVRGSELAARMGATRATNDVNMNYGLTQQQIKDAAQNRLLQGIQLKSDVTGRVASLETGAAGDYANGMREVTGMREAATSGFWNNAVTAGDAAAGSYNGMVAGNAKNKLLEQWMASQGGNGIPATPTIDGFTDYYNKKKKAATLTP